MNRALAARVHELDAFLSGSILSVPQSRQLTEARALHDAGAGIHLDLIDGGYPIGKGISRDILTEATREWPSAVDIHLIHGHHQLDDLSLDAVGRLTLHVEPGEEPAAPRPPGVREYWVSVQPDLWTGEALDHLLATWQPNGVLMMLTPPGDPRFQANLGALGTQAWSVARNRAPLGVDGGVTASHLQRIVDAGARYIVVGRALFARQLPTTENSASAPGVP